MREDRPFEVVFIARGGQGAWTSSVLFAQAALHAGKYAQSFPEFGPERSGAPVRAYARVYDRPIEIHAGTTRADVVAVIDGSLVDRVKGLVREGGVVVVNTTLSSEEVRRLVGLPESVAVYTVDGTRIALETIGRPIANTPILGALVRILERLGRGYFSLDDLVKAVEEVFGERLGRKGVESNVNAVRRAYEEVK